MKWIITLVCLCVLCSGFGQMKVAKSSVKNKFNQPALIPWPQKISWQEGVFDISKSEGILIHDDSLRPEADYLRKQLLENSINLSLLNPANKKQNIIELIIAPVNFTEHNIESYQLQVTTNKVSLTAPALHGIFNGIQTLLQMISDNKKIPAAEILDWPAFSWRGYMIDVGRNYMTMDLLKRQINAMARYKFNVFHFHPTEDIAWRFEIEKYPQLTAAEHMTRNKGKYYSETEIKELISYCKERHITFVPEIDMPGHSAAFRRAMKTDMQSDTGLQYVKDILEEICTKYDIPYVHIGADEVKITNRKFVPEVTAHIERFNKTVIGWQPGGNFTNSTIRQLWMDDNAHLSSQNNIRFIDSRHLYLNHMDPLEAVVTIFNRRIGDRDKGDQSVLGGTLCMWNDRRVEEGIDILRMNPVYPGMMAFAERSWLGGGKKGWISNIDDGDKAAFAEFEDRLLTHKQSYFKSQPFTYSKQSHLKWELYGPYDNASDLSKSFPPEQTSHKKQWKFYKEISGGTIVLRHWWHPLIKGAVTDAKENSTFYAFTRIWSDRNTEKNFWIGFNNISRSPATDSPPLGAWDDKQSEVWINNKKLPAPQWKRGGEKGNSEIPLIDEGYEYRDPTKILLKKGWNTVLLKMPAGSLKGKDWQNPVKWMFTFVEVNE